MQNKIGRRVALIVLILMLGAGVRLWWSDHSTTAPPATGVRSASGGANTDVTMRNTGVGRTGSTSGPAVSSPSTPQSVAPVHIDVQAPSAVRAGESFDVLVNLEAYGGARQVTFSIAYDKAVLRLVEANAGALVKQAARPVHFDAEEPSDGNIIVILDADKGSTIAGAGNLVALRFESLKPGSSSLRIHSVATTGNAGASVSIPDPPEATVISVY